jgi:hypothetical protein
LQTRCSSFLILFVSGNSGGHHLPEFYYPVALLAVLPLRSPYLSLSAVLHSGIAGLLNRDAIVTAGSRTSRSFQSWSLAVRDCFIELLARAPHGACKLCAALQLSSAPPGRNMYHSTPPDEEVNPQIGTLRSFESPSSSGGACRSARTPGRSSHPATRASSVCCRRCNPPAACTP